MTATDTPPVTSARPLAVAMGVMVVLLASVLLATILSSTAALHIACGPGLDTATCRATVTAALERGLARSHPLILGAAVAPGEVPEHGRTGHRATVTFDLLGVPGPTTVDLYYDIGAHWGGVVSRSPTELGLWAILVAGIVVGVVAMIPVIVVRRRRDHRLVPDSV